MTEQEWTYLIKQLRDIDSPNAHVMAAEQLHRTSTHGDLPRLFELLNDGNFFIREAAAWPVSKLVGPSAMGELLVAFERGLDEGHDNDGLTACLIDLVETRPGECKTALEALAESGDSAMKENARWLLEFCVSG